MTTAVVSVVPPRSERLPLSSRSTILAVVIAVHVAAIYLLLNSVSGAPGRPLERAFAVFDVAPSPEPPPPPPEPPPPPARAKTPPGPSLRTAPSSPQGAAAAAPRADARNPDYAPVPRTATFDVTEVATAAPRLDGTAPLPGLVDAGNDGRARQGMGAGHGSGNGRGGGGGGGDGVARANWIYQPGWREMMRFFPVAAKTAKLSGRALLACDVPEAGKPRRCEAINEAPAGQGFGEAAVQLSDLFRIRPVLKNGRAMAGIPIIIPVDFVLRGQPLPPRLACPDPFCRKVPGFE